MTIKAFFKHFNLSLLITVFITIVSCNKDWTPQPSVKSSDKLITYFGFKVSANPSLTSNIDGFIGQDTIKLFVSSSVPLNNLTPTIAFQGKSIIPQSNSAQNFTNPITYIVSAEDGTTKNYIVVVKISADSSKNITSFIFKTANNIGLSLDITGNIATDSIFVEMPNGISLTNLVPTLAITGKSVVPSSLSAQNFTQPIEYTVTAENGTVKNYKVIVSITPSTATIFINTADGIGGAKVGKVYAIDANTGILRWKYASAPGNFVSSPAFFNGTLYTGNDNKIIAIDTATRNTRWEYLAGDRISSALAIVHETIYANCDDGYLYAVDASSGILKWKFREDWLDRLNTSGNFSSPTVVDGVVYFGSSKGPYVYAVDANTGTLIWKTLNSYAGDEGSQSGPTVVNGVLYIGDIYRNLLALNINNGSIKWVLTAGALFLTSPTVVNDIVYIGSSDGYLYAVNATDGSVKWKYWTTLQVVSSPIVSQGVVYFASSGGSNSKAVYALDANTGDRKWTYSYRTDFLSSPVVFNGNVFIASFNFFLALNANTGNLKWKFDTGSFTEEIFASPCIVDQQGNIYYSSVSGHEN